MNKPILSDPVALRLPKDVFAEIEAIAQTRERTRSWVIVRALRAYLAGEGAEILAMRRGRNEVADGKVHDVEEVIRGLEAIVAGKAAGCGSAFRRRP